MEWAIAFIAPLFLLIAAICKVQAWRAASWSAPRTVGRGQTRDSGTRIRHPSRQARNAQGGTRAADVEALRAIVSGQMKEISRLREQVREAQGRLHEAGDAPADPDQFRRLRSLVLMEIHPDHATAEGADRDARTALFKRIWPKIEALSEQV